MATVLITGGTGMIGKALTNALLAKNYEVIILTRSVQIAGKDSIQSSQLSYANWDPAKGIIDMNAISSADFIIHLAGANVGARRWTRRRKREIVESRTKSCALIVQSLRNIPNKVKAVVSASGISWYGKDPVVPNPDPFTEDHSSDKAFLGETCRLWEESIHPVSELGKRLVILRTGLVFSPEAGAIREFLKYINLGIAPILGNGKQVVSWIHLDDIVKLYIHFLENELSGIFNAVTSHAVSNRDLVLKLARKIKGSLFIPVYVPAFLLKIIRGEVSVDVLKSATVSNEKLLRTGFRFSLSTIDRAMDAIAGALK